MNVFASSPLAAAVAAEDRVSPVQELFDRGTEALARALERGRILGEVTQRHLARAIPEAMARMEPPATMPRLPADPVALFSASWEYLVDAGQRAVLYWDILRHAGNTFVAHERAGCPPVLVFPYETVLDGRSLPRPVNYALVRIAPCPDMPQTDPTLRPFVIIDPRAGHGAGIGGFKSDSQVGVALRRGHPVYFVVFSRDPVEGQTILDVTAAEAVFLQTVIERHPLAPKPVVIGNCQGGWATMMLASAAPDRVGALVLNGAPLSYWAGERGRNPMRYLGGLAGGSWPALLLADLGNGKFDGANLVLNFESLSPGNTWFRKYADVYLKTDTEAERFLEFERWWGGFFLMNREEIRWIVGNLFIGNRFSAGQLAAGRGHTFNIRNVKAPIIVFASAGDNITPPGQALRWIADLYRDEAEIRGRGQTIVYLMHDQVGHLGIFVSAKIARKEHTEIANTLDLVQAVAPGLYEMRIEGDERDGFQVELFERTIEDIKRLSGDATSEEFPAVARISQMFESIYDVTAAPMIRGATTEASAELRRWFHPARIRRWTVSDLNPAVAAIAPLADAVRRDRRRAAPDNPFLAVERHWVETTERMIDAWRDARDSAIEYAFHAIYGALAVWGIGTADEAAEADAAREAVASRTPLLEEVRGKIARGGYPEAVVRMMVLLADSRGAVRRTRLARSNAMLTSEAPFAAMSAEERGELIREQTAIVTLDREGAIAALPVLLPTAEDRERALAKVEWVAGPDAELGEKALAMLNRLRALFRPAAMEPVGEQPTAPEPAEAAAE